MKSQNEMLQFWLPTGNDCDLVQATCEPSACHGAAFIAPLIRCDIFSLLVFCSYLKKPTQEILLKSAEACEHVRMHLCERKGENGFFFIFWESGGFILQEFIKGWAAKGKEDVDLKWTAMPPLLQSRRSQKKAEFKLFSWPTKEGIASSVQVQISLLIIVKSCCRYHRATDYNHIVFTVFGWPKSVIMLAKDVNSTPVPVLFVPHVLL